MTKRIFLLFICCTLMLLSAAALSGCGKEKDDLVQQGLTYIENGQYEKARNAFKKAAQEDPENVQAKETYQVVDKFLKAKEAHELGDDEAAAEYLEDLPERYQNLSIAEDINRLLRSLKSSLPDAEKKDKDAASTEKNGKASATDTSNKDIFSAQEEIDLQLQIAEKLLNTDLYDSALESLQALDMTYARTEQKTKYNEIKEKAEKGKNQEAAKDEENPGEKDFTPEKAMEYLREEYPDMAGDLGLEELPAKYDENNHKYYELPMQYNGETFTVQIFSDGRVIREDR